MQTDMMEREARAAILFSLAKSQQALARILDSMADVVDSSPESAKLLRDNVRSLTDLQETIAETVTGLAWRRRVKRRGTPAEPWLQASVALIRCKGDDDARLIRGR
ncbi:hypothetical protein L1N85_08985 [Paenibacillus alkaliterrae]|uniref:hypothetical protein n=1 Tax=Paenibacillus alkaliterrae TaxID=320909 RepID=UPI001F1AE73D|nr:hypothetical protein [Paenibacillus alkaliterrae]MCF2938569.1 hypothetical protein [Paenibacillus alkaliterrae]